MSNLFPRRPPKGLDSVSARISTSLAQRRHRWLVRITQRKLTFPVFGLCRDDGSLLVLVLAIKLLLLCFGVWTFTIVNNQSLHSFADILGVWNRWDGTHYLDIARDGYNSSGDARLLLVFYPFYPILVHVTTLVLGNILYSGFIVSAVASLALAILMRRLVALDYPADLAWNAVWFLFIFPTSYFLHIDYTESLLLLLVVSAFLAARRSDWPLAGVIGMLASLTHSNGILLAPALGLEALLGMWRARRWNSECLWLGLVPLGLLGYLWINYRVAGRPFDFLHSESGHWAQNLVPPWTGLGGTIGVMLHYAPGNAQMIGVQVLFYMILALSACIYSAVKLPLSYTVWSVANWLLFACASWDLSGPRYILVIFPIFIMFADLARRQIWYRLITVWSLIWLGFFASQFALGHWAF
ncbi:MAG TPA: hypothetical protein VMF50_00070, partial [Candidatus Binataceae bacterium]|nr:hypothetical protein [Candidatus Binataceae bacterium]